MAFRVRGSPRGPGAPKASGKPDQTSSLGPGGSALSNVGNAPKPVRSRRNYGKTKPTTKTPQPNPFGPTYRGI